MTTPAERKRQLDDALREAALGYQSLNARQQGFAINEIERTRREVNGLLAEYAKKDNTIARNRLNTFLRDLEDVERQIRRNGMNAMERILKDSANSATTGAERAMIAAYGRNAGIGIDFTRMNNDVFRYVANRFGDDGLILSDRVWQIAGDQKDAISKAVRNGIIQGKSVNQMVADVRKAYDNETWKIERLVRTEGNTAYRTADAYYAQRSNVIIGLKIHPGAADQPSHKCSILANDNPHGLGRGVYTPDNTEILNPHPNCTSFVTYVLDEDRIKEVAA